MGISDKISSVAKEAVGKAKETVGEVLNNDDLKHQGQIDQAAAKGEKIGGDVKDLGKDIADKADDAKDEIADKADDAKDKIGDVADDVKDNVKDAVDDLKKKF